jgi:peptide chain release factor 1
MDLAPLIALKQARFDELEHEIGREGLFDDPQRARDVMREHARARAILERWAEFTKATADLEANRAMVGGADQEFAELARAEVPALEAKSAALELELRELLLPPDPNEQRDAIVEIRAGTGGEEAALFAGDLFRMYTRFAEKKGLKLEPMESSPSDLGGFREVIFQMSGSGVFREMKYESGVHRVQRVPATEAQGRIHTSTATVAVLPEAEEVEIALKPEELRIEVCRAGGPGGQGVNTTDSAVQVMHIPTGRIVRCQDGRSQQKNKERALQILRARLLEDKQREEAEKYSAHRRSQIGSGGREEKIRTYNFPQNRVTDHRIGRTQHNLDLFLEGDIEEMIQALRTEELAERFREAGAGAPA